MSNVGRYRVLLLVIAQFLLIPACTADLVAERPMPNDRAAGVRANPTLVWSLPGENILTNGGFEQGYAGWSFFFSGSPPRGGLSTTYHIEGTNSLKIDIGTASTKITLPTDGGPIVWSFGVVSYFRGVSASVRNAAGEELRSDPFLTADTPAALATNFYAMDLTDFKGQTVTLSLSFSGDTGAFHYLDDVRVTVLPANAEFNVYLNMGPTPRFVGHTNKPSWPLTNLFPSSLYLWRVDTIIGGVTNTGPLWRFNTGIGYQSSGITFTTMPTDACPGAKTPFEALLLDNLGFPFSTSGITFTPVADNARPPSVVISELDTSLTNRIEFINASTNTISLTNWKVEIFINANSSVSQTVYLPPEKLAGGEMFTLTSSFPGASWPNLRMNANDWGGSSPTGAILLRDATNGIVDCLLLRKTGVAVSQLDWFGPTVTNSTPAGSTHQRVGVRNTHSSSDWTVAPSTFRAENSNLQIPLAPGFGQIKGALIQTATGHPNRTILIPTPSLNARILAKTSSNLIYGQSDPFQVVEPAFCLTLSAPESVMENDPTAQLHLSIGSPAISDLLINLTSSHPTVAQVAPTVTIPAGATEAVAPINPINNSLLEGSKLISVTAQAPNYSLAKANLKIIDDEKATLSIEAPAVWREGDLSQQIVVNISAAPATNINVRYYFDLTGPNFGTAYLPANSNQLTFGFSDDFYIQGNFLAHFRVEYENWTGDSVEFSYIDNDPPTIDLFLPEPIFEGGKQSGRIRLGGPVVTNTPITLASSQPDILGVPATVIIPAFTQEAYFDYVGLLTSRPAGPQTIKVTANGPGLIETNATTTVTLYPPEPSLSIERLSASNSLRVHFPAEAGMAYYMNYSANPNGPWSYLAPIPVNNGVAEITLTIDQIGSRFFVVSQSAL